MIEIKTLVQAFMSVELILSVKVSRLPKQKKLAFMEMKRGWSICAKTKIDRVERCNTDLPFTATLLEDSAHFITPSKHRMYNVLGSLSFSVIWFYSLLKSIKILHLETVRLTGFFHTEKTLELLVTFSQKSSERNKHGLD